MEILAAVDPPVLALGAVAVLAIVIVAAALISRAQMARKLDSYQQEDVERTGMVADALAARGRLERELADALREREALIETVPDILYELDADSRLILWNKQVERVTGLTADELKGKPCAEFVIPAEQPLVPGMLQNCIVMGKAVQEFHLVRANGPPVPYQFVKAPIRDRDGRVRGFAGVGRDISERKTAARRREAQHAATRVLAQNGSEAETLRAILSVVAQALEWEFAAAWLIDERVPALRCVATWRASPVPSDFEDLTRGMRFAPRVGLPGRVWSSGEPRWIQDVTRDDNFPRRSVAKQEGLHGAFAFPVRRGDKILGVVEFFSERVEEPDRELLQLMASVGSQLGIYLERKRTEGELASLNEMLNARVDELASANRELETFGYTVSHDLRAPLRAVRHHVEILVEELLAERTSEGIARAGDIQREVERMGHIIEDLTELAKTSRATATRTRVDVGEIARTVVADLRSREPDRKVEFVAQGQLTAEAEPGLVTIVLENLLGNAWKFTRARKDARVELGLVERGGERVFFVRDNGAGFDSSKADRLFRPFQRLHSAKEFEGTGVGLATVRQAVSRHGGRAWAEGQEGKGATFYFTLAPAAKETARPSTSA